MSQTMSAPACLMSNSPKLPQCVCGAARTASAPELSSLMGAIKKGQMSHFRQRYVQKVKLLLAIILEASEELVALSKERTHSMCEGLAGEHYALKYDMALDPTMTLYKQIECAEEDCTVQTLKFEQTRDIPGYPRIS
jgi:hypothetical protein